MASLKKRAGGHRVAFDWALVLALAADHASKHYSCLCAAIESASRIIRRHLFFSLKATNQTALHRQLGAPQLNNEIDELGLQRNYCCSVAWD